MVSSLADDGFIRSISFNGHNRFESIEGKLSCGKSVDIGFCGSNDQHGLRFCGGRGAIF